MPPILVPLNLLNLLTWPNVFSQGLFPPAVAFPGSILLPPVAAFSLLSIYLFIYVQRVSANILFSF